MLFSPDDLHGQLPASREQVERLAQRSLVANREAGRGFAVIAVALDGFADWELRMDRGFADGLFRAVLAHAIEPREALVCGYREGGQALFFVQGLDLAEAKGLVEEVLVRARQVNLSARGGPVQSTLSAGGAHGSGFATPDGSMRLADGIRAALRGARLATRSGGDRCAWIERFGPAPQRDVASPSAAPVQDTPPAETTQASPAPGHPATPEPAKATAPNGVPSQGSGEGAGDVTEDVGASDWKALPEVDLEADLEALLMNRYGAAFSSYLQGREVSWERRVELLERRIEKLGHLLEGEQALRRAHRSGTPTEAGLASRFRSVQGLDEGDQQFEAKQGLMSAIYEANLKLREQDPGRTAG